MPEVYEGVLEDLIDEHDLHGKTVRLEVLNSDIKESLWFKKLKLWIEENKVSGGAFDDSRDNIYSGTIDDPR